jgi:hypothetical protein
MKKIIASTALGSLLSLTTMSSFAAVYGGLANFDVVNDTGATAHGFEIEIDDIRQTEITSIFGSADRWPNMERYGAPTVVESFSATAARTQKKVLITYQSALVGSNWVAGTPSGTLPVSPNDSCWPYGAPNYGPNYPCDHFGVSTSVSTPNIQYRWLVESSPGSTSLSTVAATVPNPVWTVTPQPPINNQPQPPIVHVVIAAPEPNEFEFGEPRWVKVTATGVMENVAVEDLVAENPVIQQAETQVQVEWQLIQVDVGSPGSGQIDLTGVALDPGAKAVVYRFEFYQYIGGRDPQTNEAQPLTSDTPVQPDPADLGEFIVAQNAGVNFDGNIPAAPPLPIPPTLNASIIDAVLNAAYSQQIDATPSTPGDVLNYEVTGLPAGLSVNVDTGLISGTATGPLGDYPITITVNDVTNHSSISGSTTMSVLDGGVDADGDGVPDVADNCPADSNADQSDLDGDGIGDVCDPTPVPGDSDNDGVGDGVDNCPLVANPDQADNDHDRVGDACDTDDDNDTLSDVWEQANGHNPMKADYMVSAGGFHSCALDNVGVKCWGNNTYGQVTVPALSAPTMVSAGYRHSCAVDSTGVKCWGKGVTNTGVLDDFGQSIVPSLTNPTAVSAGYWHTCAIDATGVKCWGKNTNGQTNAPALNHPLQVAAGRDYSCALDEAVSGTRSVKCWGIKGAGQLNVPALVNPQSISLSVSHACAVDQTGVVCWGKNNAGQTIVPGLTYPQQSAVGTAHSCALDSGSVVCWGDPALNTVGQTTVPVLNNPVTLEAGLSHTCVLDNTGVKCWGRKANAKVPALAITPHP